MTTDEKPRPKPAPPKPRTKPGESPEVGELREKINRPEPIKEKPKFVRKPHLTDRPFKENAELQKLQKSMEHTTPRRGQRRSNKESK
jgi:hypothetical protein